MKTLGEEYPCPYCGSNNINHRTKDFVGGHHGFGYIKWQWYCKKCQTSGPLLKKGADEGWKKISTRQPEQCYLFGTAPKEDMEPKTQHTTNALCHFGSSK